MRDVVLSPTITFFSFLFIIVVVVLVGFWSFQTLKSMQASAILKYNMPDLGNKKIVMVIAFKNFRDEEYFVPKGILEYAGAEVKTASNQKGMAVGTDGGEVEVDLLVSEVNLYGFDAVVFIGGPGCLLSLDNEDSYRLVKDTVSRDKVLASICVSPTILAKAGVLKGKRATVWSSLMDKGPIKILEDNGAIYENKPVVVDGKLITGNGPDAAKQFGEAIVKLLE